MNHHAFLCRVAVLPLPVKLVVQCVMCFEGRAEQPPPRPPRIKSQPSQDMLKDVSPQSQHATSTIVPNDGILLCLFAVLTYKIY